MAGLWEFPGGKVATLCFLCARPAPRSRVIIGSADNRAGFTANGPVALQPQGMGGQMVGLHVVIQIEGREGGQWLYLYLAVLNAQEFKCFAGCPMKAFATRNNDVIGSEGLLHGLGFANVAATVLVDLIQRAVAV